MSQLIDITTPVLVNGSGRAAIELTPNGAVSTERHLTIDGQRA